MMMTVLIEPLLHAVLAPTAVVWFSFSPECDLPGSAVRPLPSALLLQVVASNPGNVQATLFHSLQHKVFGGLRGDGCQMATLPLAEVFSGSPALLVSAPEVAVFPFHLPAFFTGFHAIASRT